MCSSDLLDARVVEVDVREKAYPSLEIIAGSSMEEVDINLKDMLYSERLTLIEDDVAPVGIFSEKESAKDRYVVEGGDVWTSESTTPLY